MQRHTPPPVGPHPYHHHAAYHQSPRGGTTGVVGAVALGLGGTALVAGALGASMGGFVSPLLVIAAAVAFLASALAGESDAAPQNVVRMRPVVFVAAMIAGLAATLYAAVTILTVLAVTGAE